MKRALFLNVLVVALALALGGVGCKRTSKAPTPLPAKAQRAPGTTTNPPPIGGGGSIGGGNVGSGPGATGTDTKSSDLTKENPAGRDQADLALFEGMKMDTNTFAANTIHFDFDSAVVKRDQQPLADAVAEQLKLQPNDKLLIDGHTDDRGTEQYNLALGERRALAVREYLIGRGIAGDRIRTRSFGEEFPVDPAQNDAAWARNRRAEFILLLPKE